MRTLRDQCLDTFGEDGRLTLCFDCQGVVVDGQLNRVRVNARYVELEQEAVFLTIGVHWNTNGGHPAIRIPHQLLKESIEISVRFGTNKKWHFITS